MVPAPPTVKKPLKKRGLKRLSKRRYPVFKDDFKDKEGLVTAARKSIDYLKKQDMEKTFTAAGRTYRLQDLADTTRELIRVVRLAETGEDLDALIRERFESSGSSLRTGHVCRQLPGRSTGHPPSLHSQP